MKNLFLSAAIMIGTFSFANVTAPVLPETICVQDEYTAIKVEEVPEAVLTSLKKNYPDAVVQSAAINAAKEYKLDITNKDVKAVVYFDAAGTELKK